MAYQRVTSSDTFNSGATAATTVINAIETGLEAAETTIASQTSQLSRQGLLGRRTIFFGTSITNQGWPTRTDPSNNGLSPICYGLHANYFLKQRLNVIANAGVSGNTSTQMLARITTDVINKNPNLVIVESAMANDIGNAFTVATSIANHKSIYDQIKATGAQVVVCTPTPYGAVTTGSWDTVSSRTTLGQFRAWQLMYARDNGFIIADWWPQLTVKGGIVGTPSTATITTATFSSPTLTVNTSAAHGFVAGQYVTIAGNSNANNNGQWLLATASGTQFTITNSTLAAGTGGTATNTQSAAWGSDAAGNSYVQDQVHPTPAGASVMGKILADAISPRLDGSDAYLFPAHNGDGASGIYNPMMLGTGGTLSTGGTGNVADKWTCYVNSGTLAYTASKVARTDGILGEWQQFAFTSGTAGVLKFQQNMYSGAWSVGDTIRFSVEFQLDNDWTGNMAPQMLITSTGLGVSTNVATGYPIANKANTTGILSCWGVIPTGAPNVQMQILVGGSGLTGTIRIGRVGVQNLTTLGLTAFSGI